jgi:putative ABC transport system substrate-binding protein
MAAPEPAHPNARALLHELGRLGYAHGKNLNWLPRSAEGRFEHIPEILREVAAQKVDVIVASDNDTARAAQTAAPGVPLVVIFLGDPVELGLVASLAKPGGDMTGVARTTGSEFEGKRLQLLREALPGVRRVSFLGREQDWKGPTGQAVQAAARSLGLTLLHAQNTADDYAPAFAALARDRPDAVFVAENTPNFAHRKVIVEFTAKNRLPAIFWAKEFVEAGGLISYGTDLPGLYRGAARYVDRILKGAKPGALPIERADKFELIVNLEAARALGVAIPGPVLARADRVLQ